MTTIAEVQQMPRTERAHRLAFIRILAHLGPVACFPAEEVDWLLKEINDQAAEIEQLRAALAMADVLAHQYVFTPFHKCYWQARGGHDACTVCCPVEPESKS